MGQVRDQKKARHRAIPLGMAMYAIELTPLLNMMLGAVIGAIMVTFTDDYTSVGSVRYHNLPQPRKSWLIVKQQNLGQAREIFKDTKISKISYTRRTTAESGDWREV